jgi:hypothetical protein
MGEGSNPDLGPFLQAVNLAKTTTEGWSGRFLVVIMPLYQDVVAGQLPPVLRHAALAATLSKAGFDVVDGGEIFQRQVDPRGLYTMRINNHPNREGYALLGREVVSVLEQRYPETVAGIRR